jgi:hypothetical protein
MQEIKYIIKIWLSGLLSTPVVYILLLTLFSGFRFPAATGVIVTTFAVPYSVLMSVWMALGLLATMQLSRNAAFMKQNLFTSGFLMPFAAMTMINFIAALQSYGGGYLLAFAYAISTILFIWLYPSNLPIAKPQKAISESIKDSVIYGLTVWLFTFLLSTPISVLIWIATKDFKSISIIKTVQDILERYNFQLSLSIAYFITVAFITLIVVNQNITKNKKKAIIFLFAFPITFPALFYYLLFSGDIYTNSLFEYFRLIFPSTIISALSIWLIDITPGTKKKD